MSLKKTQGTIQRQRRPRQVPTSFTHATPKVPCNKRRIRYTYTAGKMTAPLFTKADTYDYIIMYTTSIAQRLLFFFLFFFEVTFIRSSLVDAVITCLRFYVSHSLLLIGISQAVFCMCWFSEKTRFPPHSFHPQLWTGGPTLQGPAGCSPVPAC